MRNHQLGWALSSNGRLFATTQGGINWQISDTISQHNLLAIDFADEENGWIVGDKGVILHTSDADGGLFIEDIHTASSGFNIFPNPATSDVFIENVSKKQWIVSIEIMDQSGKALTEKRLQLSADEIRNVWNIQAFPAGIYFIKISYENNEEFRKLLKY